MTLIHETVCHCDVIRLRVRRCILFANLEEGDKYGVRILEVVMNHVYEVSVVQDVRNELA